MTNLTVQLTLQDVVTATLPTGRKLTLRIASLPHGTRYLMAGATTGSHDIAVEANSTSPERLRAHWDGYVQIAMTAPEEQTALAKLMAAARAKRAAKAIVRHAVSQHTTLIMKGEEPVRVENDGNGDDPVNDAAQFLGHPLESGEARKRSGKWVYKVWKNEDCTCSACH